MFSLKYSLFLVIFKLTLAAPLISCTCWGSYFGLFQCSLDQLVVRRAASHRPDYCVHSLSQFRTSLLCLRLRSVREICGSLNPLVKLYLLLLWH